MATETIRVVDQITVAENGVVLFRIAERTVENGEVIQQTFVRSSIEPGQGVSELPARVRAICEVSWTPEVIAAYQEARAEAMK